MRIHNFVKIPLDFSIEFVAPRYIVGEWGAENSKRCGYLRFVSLLLLFASLFCLCTALRYDVLSHRRERCRLGFFVFIECFFCMCVFAVDCTLLVI
jgi:hypothetical protein